MNIKMSAFADEASRSIDGQIEAMKRNGIELLEIRFVGEKNIKDVTNIEAKEIKNRLADHGMRVWSIGSPTGKIKMEDDFEPHLDSFKHQLELAQIMGADRYRLFSFYNTDNSEGCFQAVCERMNRMVEAAKGSGIQLCHENEKGIFGDIAIRCKKLLDAIPSLRAIFDPANFLQCGQNTLEAWEMLAPYVDYLHIKDCNAEGKVVPPGMGLGELPTILKKFSDQGGGVATLEPHLTAFIGLDQLENGERTKSAFHYATSDDAFDAAASALRKMITEG